MALYSGNTATEAKSGGSYEPGAHKFRITEASMNDWGGLNYKFETKDAEGNEGPNCYDTLNFNSQSDAVKAEIDRRLTTMLGKVSIDRPEELVGKVGYVMLRKGWKGYLEPMPFGGYFGENKLSATGNADSFATAEQQAKDYDWKQDSYAVKKYEASQGHLSQVDSDDSDPF